jgi:cell wall-associated NlpC family hydrolase
VAVGYDLQGVLRGIGQALAGGAQSPWADSNLPGAVRPSGLAGGASDGAVTPSELTPFGSYVAANNPAMGNVMSGAVQPNSGGYSSGGSGAVSANQYAMEAVNGLQSQQQYAPAAMQAKQQASNAQTALAAAAANASGALPAGSDKAVAAIKAAWGDVPDSDPGLRAALAMSHAESSWNPTAGNTTVGNNGGENSHGIFQTNLQAHPDITLDQANDPMWSANYWVPRIKQAQTAATAMGLSPGSEAWVRQSYKDAINPGADVNGPQANRVVSSWNNLDRLLTPASVAGDPKAIQAKAQGVMGQPYVWGGKSPQTGFDCSGFAGWMLGTGTPESTVSLWGKSHAVDAAGAQPGDMVFWNMDQKDPTQQHVAIYEGGNNIVEAGGDQATVHESHLNQSIGTFSGFRRIPR